MTWASSKYLWPIARFPLAPCRLPDLILPQRSRDSAHSIQLSFGNVPCIVAFELFQRARRRKRVSCLGAEVDYSTPSHDSGEHDTNDAQVFAPQSPQLLVLLLSLLQRQFKRTATPHTCDAHVLSPSSLPPSMQLRALLTQPQYSPCPVLPPRR